jgi:hypothetical protein
MPGATSFYFAMFRRFQAICGIGGSGHVNPDSTDAQYLYGGFSLQSTQDAQGIFGQLGPQAATWQLTPGMQPLNPASNDPMQNPLFVMLNASAAPAPVPTTVVVLGQTWPVMPPPPEDEFTIWLEANASAPRLIDAFAAWISNGKVDDAPKDPPISFAALDGATVPPWPFKKTEFTPILFVPSFPADDGRRHGDHALPDVPANHVPSDFWAQSMIFLTDETGHTASPAKLKASEEYYVVAQLRNAGNIGGGEVNNFNNPKFQVLGDAQCFNTFTSPGTPLPSLDNIDPAGSNPAFDVRAMTGPVDVAGFRFNVDAVFAGLKAALVAQVPPAMLGNATADEWLTDGHPCVKVRILSGEQLNEYGPASGPIPPTLESNPMVDRHIAQRNLAPFDMALMGLKKIMWTNFIVGQAGAGWNELILQQALPADAFRFHFAVPRAAWERWIDPRTSPGGAVRGLEMVHDVASKPFPEAVILRQTGPVLIRIAEHGHGRGHERERFFGMSLGIEGDPAAFRRARNSDVSVVQAAHGGGVVGGFTLRVPLVR